MQFFATCAKALEPLVADELRTFGAADVVETRAGVVVHRRARDRLSRLLVVARGQPRPLDAGNVRRGRRRRALRRRAHHPLDRARRPRSTPTRRPHTHSSALKTKDAIVDQLRDEVGRRPSVDTAAPDLRVNVHVAGGKATVSIDLSGESLHRRGYRAIGVEAPLKENLAAAILLLAEWPASRRSGRAARRSDVRLGHAADRGGAHRRRRRAGPRAAALRLPRLARPRRRRCGSACSTRRARASGRSRRRSTAVDQDPRAVQIARENARRAGVADAIDFRVVDLWPTRRRRRAAAGPGRDEPALRRAARRDARARRRSTSRSATSCATASSAGRRSCSRQPRAAEAHRPARRRAATSSSTARSSAACSSFPSPRRRPQAPMRARASVRGEAFANRLRKNFKHRRSGPSARTCTAVASTTPISSSTPSPSTSTRPRRTCRSTRRRRRSIRRAPRSASATSSRSCPRCSASPPRTCS